MHTGNPNMINMATFVTSLLLVMTSYVQVISAFSRGAPQYACKNLTPGHSGAPLKQTDVPAPFSLKVSDGVVVPGGSVDVTVSATGGVPFKGFLCVATDDTDATVQRGSMAAGGSEGKPVFCDKNDAQTPYGMTHQNNNDKTSATFTWTAPQAAQAGIGSTFIIRCVIVQKFDTYWNDFESSVMIVQTGGMGGMMGGGAASPTTSGTPGNTAASGNTATPVNNNAGASGTTDDPSNSASTTNAVSGSRTETGSGPSSGVVSPVNFRGINDENINDNNNTPPIEPTTGSRIPNELFRQVSVESTTAPLSQSTRREPLPVQSSTNSQPNQNLPINAPVRSGPLPASGFDNRLSDINTNNNNLNPNADTSANQGQQNIGTRGGGSQTTNLVLVNSNNNNNNNANINNNSNDPVQEAINRINAANDNPQRRFDADVTRTRQNIDSIRNEISQDIQDLRAPRTRQNAIRNDGNIRNSSSRLRWFQRTPGRVGGRRGDAQQRNSIRVARVTGSSRRQQQQQQQLQQQQRQQQQQQLQKQQRQQQQQQLQQQQREQQRQQQQQQRHEQLPNTINGINNLVQDAPLSAFSSRHSHLISLIMRSSRVRPPTLNNHLFSK